MLKALLKKQFLEINTFYFLDKRTGKRRSAGATLGFAALFVFIFASCAAAFVGMSMLFGSAFFPLGMDWLYFSLMGMIAVFLSSLINMFIAGTQLYRARDNALLLAMPIPPSEILLVRMAGLYAWGLLYEAICFLPAVVVYWVQKGASLSGIVMPLLVFLLASFAILTLSSVFGWVVALVGSRLKNRAVLSVLLALVLIGVYYVCYFRLNRMLYAAAENAAAVGHAVSAYLFPFYHMGLAAAGSPGSLLIFAAITAAAFALVYYVLQHSFIRIATADRGAKKAVYQEHAAKQTGAGGALLKKELRHFVSSPAYMLNMGLGLIIMPAAGIFALIRADVIREYLAAFSGIVPGIVRFVPAAVAAACCLLLSMCCFTAPSVSLEGKNLWLLQSLPVSAKDVLGAKRALHLCLDILPALIFTVTVGLAAGLGAVQIVLIAAAALAYMALSAEAGLVINLKKPNFTWTNETVPIKQSLSVTVALLGGWGVSVLFAAGGYLLRNLIAPELYCGAVALLFALGAYLVRRRLNREGETLFRRL